MQYNVLSTTKQYRKLPSIKLPVITQFYEGNSSHPLPFPLALQIALPGLNLPSAFIGSLLSSSSISLLQLLIKDSL